jgi:hypothetical protein
MSGHLPELLGLCVDYQLAGYFFQVNSHHAHALGLAGDVSDRIADESS